MNTTEGEQYKMYIGQLRVPQGVNVWHTIMGNKPHLRHRTSMQQKLMMLTRSRW